LEGIVKGFSSSLSIKGALPNVKSTMQTVLQMTAQEARNQWVKLARQRFHVTSSAYVNSIEDPVFRGNQVTITLRADSPEGKLANMLEQGSEPFDMKPGFLRSPKAKIGGKIGRTTNKYITIPLRLKSSGSMGGSPPVMPSTIYKKASQLEIGGRLTLSKKYEGLGLRTRLSADLKRWQHYTWKTSPFQNIVKVPRFTGLVKLGLPRESAGMYMVFRRVSKKSNPSSWIHPGFKAANLVDQVVSKVELMFPTIIDNVMGAM
jgi:hypothetical protein